MALLVILAFLALCIGINAVIHFSQKKKSVKKPTVTESPRVFTEDSVAAPEGLYYDKSHSWAFMKQNGRVKVGVDDFLLKVTGKLSRVNLKNEGDRISKGEPLVSIIQNGKRLTVKAPVSGIIKSQNKSLEHDAKQLKSSPYVQGWLYEIEPTNWLREIQLLLIGDKYREWIKSEFARLKDFIAMVLSTKQVQTGMVTLQDGGELFEDVLSEFEPHEWEMFQNNFLDRAK
jgi:glycine cleavage system H lipoate-binding protein